GIAVCLYTGIRIGELCAMQWKDIDLEKRTLTVKKTIQRIQTPDNTKRTKLVITEPKSQSSIRIIPIPECLAEKLGSYVGNEDDYILSGTSKPVEPRTMQNRFARILKNANLPSLHFHSLRHAFATKCIALGFDVKTLSEILGHSSIELTLNRYVHSSMDRKKACMDKLTWAA
ncbi:MAG: site-specific integrase, partial [Ruminiclostridium sp.]|nr:site-specific integrase [Ruminiclostridium sp.]